MKLNGKSQNNLKRKGEKMKKIQMWFLWCLLVALTYPCFAANSVEWVNVKDIVMQA